MLAKIMILDKQESISNIFSASYSQARLHMQPTVDDTIVIKLADTRECTAVRGCVFPAEAVWPIIMPGQFIFSSGRLSRLYSRCSLARVHMVFRLCAAGSSTIPTAFLYHVWYQYRSQVQRKGLSATSTTNIRGAVLELCQCPHINLRGSTLEFTIQQYFASSRPHARKLRVSKLKTSMSRDRQWT